jgi:hypothetical protein
VTAALGLGLLFASCGGDVRIASNSFCDGIEQPSEDGVDAPFDGDGDGYFDGANDGCADYYEETDCDDNDAAINPGATEVQCDGDDNDCNADTLEAEDSDGDGILACTDCDDNDATETAEQDVDFDEDGSDACFDCDDSDPTNYPGNEEVCDNRDNDCSGVADDGVECFTDYSGTWAVTPAVSYACAFNSVTINVGALTVTDAGSVIVFAGVGGSQPGAMNGTRDGDTFTTTNFISSGGGGCDETYDLSGTFLSMSEFTATLNATFTGGAACYDCTNQSWSIIGSR